MTLSELNKQLEDAEFYTNISVYGDKAGRDKAIGLYREVLAKKAKLITYYETFAGVVDTGILLP